MVEKVSFFFLIADGAVYHMVVLLSVCVLTAEENWFPKQVLHKTYGPYLLTAAYCC